MWLRRFLERRWLRPQAETGGSDADYEQVWRVAFRLKLRRSGFLVLMSALWGGLSFTLLGWVMLLISGGPRMPYGYGFVFFISMVGFTWVGLLVATINFFSRGVLPPSDLSGPHGGHRQDV